ncbi:NHL repeat-containing protein [Luteimonas marina]|uniref:NHL repeat-containing protein n=1 Tax=Luteimonas marina TaxID=488485 RepID=UPI001EE2DB47|nr:NHL repeat-containing protein [Luteimonas marina]
MNRRAGRRVPTGVRRALVAVAALTALALAATFLFGPLRDWLRGPLPPPPPTSFDWRARIAPLAGTGLRGVRDGHALEARFDEPWGLVRGADGSLFVADGGEANRIRRIAPDGRVGTFAGSGEGFADGIGAQARFHTPSSLAVDRLGNLYVADTGNHAIRKITRNGAVTTLAGTGIAGFRDGDAALAQFHAPMGVAVDDAGRVYVADTWNDRIRVIERDGRVRTLAGGEGAGFASGPGMLARFDTPTALAVAGDGTLWVADTGNRALRRLDPDGEVRTWVPSVREGGIDPGRPLAVAVAHDGVLYVADLSPGRVLQVDPDGRVRALTGVDPAQWFARPSALWLEADGSLLLADAAGHRLHRIVPRVIGDNALADGPVGPRPDRPLPDTRGRWPLFPQDAWHEVVGTLGEVRGNFSGERRSHLHNGLDVRGDVGASVLLIADAKVTSPLAAFSFGGQAEGVSVDELTYLHMRAGRTPQGRNLDPARFLMEQDEDGRPSRVRIARGTRFRAGEPLGTINAQAHVHLIVGPHGHQHNAIRLGFRGYVDTVPPRIDGIALLDEDDRPIATRANGRVRVPRNGGGVQVVVDAWDQVDGNLPRRRLGLHRVGYQVLRADGTPAPGFEAPAMNLDFSRMPAHPDAVKLAYAADSGITVHGAARTRFLYVASNRVRAGELAASHWQPSQLPPGDYLVRAFGEDASGNAAIGARDLPVTLVDEALPLPETETGRASR